MEYLYFAFFAIGIILSLFTLFVLSKNDFVLLRRGIMQKDIFDTTFLSFIAGFVIARIFYIFDTFQFSYFNPIQFFHLILYPGLSLFGYFVGFVSVIIYSYLRKKAFLRAFDLFLTSFYWMFLSYLFYGIFFHGYDILRIVHFCVSLLLFIIFVHFYRHFSIKDGSSGMLIFLYTSISYVVVTFDVTRTVLLYVFSFGQLAAIFAAIVTFVVFFIHQFIRKT